MATSLIYTQAFWLSSALQDLSWSTDQQQVHVRLYYQHTGQILLETTLAAIGGTARLYQTRELVERYMRLRGIARLYPLQVQHMEGSSWVHDAAMTVIYCELDMMLPSGGTSQFLEQNFLTSRKAKVLPTDEQVIEQLFFVQPQGTPEAPVLHVTYLDDEGGVAMGDITLQADYGAAQGNLYVCEFSLATVKQAIQDAVTVIAVTVSVGSRHMEYYRAARRGNVAFRFANAFNVPESAYLSAVVNRKTEDGRKIARIAGTLALYDRRPVTSYEVQTAPLSYEQAGWIDQLITSPDVCLIDGTQVIITDGTAECHNDNAELNSAKFTYSQLDMRHTVSDMVQPANIFTVPPHSYQFA